MRLHIIFSWGFRNPIALENGILFRVDGFKHQGWVVIKYDTAEDLFVVELYNIFQAKTQAIESIYVEDLVDVIDKAVEYTNDYEYRVKETYNIQ
jgi:hypothetical protein